jgi:hypothetical protein
MAKVLANAQMSMVSAKPINASWVNNNTNLGKMGAQIVAATLPTTKPMTPKPNACCKIIMQND